MIKVSANTAAICSLISHKLSLIINFTSMYFIYSYLTYESEIFSSIPTNKQTPSLTAVQQSHSRMPFHYQGVSLVNFWSIIIPCFYYLNLQATSTTLGFKMFKDTCSLQCLTCLKQHPQHLSSSDVTPLTCLTATIILVYKRIHWPRSTIAPSHCARSL